MVDDSREQSPDWLRSFQAPSRSFLSISSSSEPSLSNSPSQEEHESGKGMVAEKLKIEYDVLENSEDEKPAVKTRNTWTLKSEKQEEDRGSFDSVDEKPNDKTKKSKKLKEMEEQDPIEEDAYEGEIAEKDGSKKAILSNVSSRLPLVLPEKVQRSKVLIECEGDAIDLSGDVGAIGRVIISKTSSGNDEMLLDLKGTIYKSTIVPSTTFCVVSFGQTEAKIESIMTDFVQLKPHSNVFEAETMIEGTLDGFSFDSEDEKEYLQKPAAYQNDQETENANQSMGKRSGKVEKVLGVRKKAKPTGKPSAKPVKRAARKPQTTKKGKVAKK